MRAHREKREVNAVEQDVDEAQSQDLRSRDELLKMKVDQKVSEEFTDFGRSIHTQ
jgi:hypothetical protein